MLVLLRIRQFVLIEELELRFEPGFNVLTGETGSGKSILVDALALVFGQRVTSEVVRPGAEEAEVEALFDVTRNPSLLARLLEAGMGADGELVVRRVVHKSGRSRAYVNGRICSAKELVELTRELGDITSQHESVALVDPRTHLDYLDRFAGLVEGLKLDGQPGKESERAALALAYQAVCELDERLMALRGRERDRQEREAFVRFQLEAIDAVRPEGGELETLNEELTRLKHGEKLRGAAIRVTQALDGEDGAMCDELGRLASELASAASLDEGLRAAATEVQECWTVLAEVSRGLGQYLNRLVVDPTRLEEIQSRLFRLEKLARSHGPSLADVLLTRARLEGELTGFAAVDAQLPELLREREVALGKAASLARRLSKRRHEASKRLAKTIASELAELGMAGAQVGVVVSPRPGKEGEPLVDGARLNSTGIDRVELLLSPNPGGELRALGQTASGGELSRVLLALRRALLDSGHSEARAGIVVLDEIDAGVGGETADRIGRAIGSIANERQVLCITHLASIAAYADAHFVVTKTMATDSTSSTACAVEGPARVAELARMLTGARNGTTERAARDLLSAAKRTRTRPSKAA